MMGFFMGNFYWNIMGIMENHGNFDGNNFDGNIMGFIGNGNFYWSIGKKIGKP